MDNTTPDNILSFVDLLNQQKKIEIPIIQRDYAQGRSDKKEIRNNFLNAIKDSVVNQNPIKLDFIYGSKINDDVFQPLDGQQRLTTLFLLHWYAMIKGNIHTPDNIELLNKFSYETRITSREFCAALIQFEFALNEKDIILSEIIKDSKWFFISWKNDPTIDSMLRMIDEIHHIFFEVENLWDSLVTQKIITFYHVELEDIGLTDDLYIKMNARGKLLSPFENFKASFEDYIDSNDWEKDINEQDKFSFKIDTNWTDFFWNHFKKNNNIDDAFMKFISTLLMIRLSSERGSDRIGLISQLQEDYSQIKSNLISKETYEYIYNCFEIYSQQENFEKFEFPFTFWRHTPIKNFLSEVVHEEKNASYTQKVLFYAQTEYLLRNPDFNKTNFDNWMRVIRNIVSRGNVEKGGKRPDIIRSPETFDGVINLIHELASGSENIYDYLSSTERLNSTFARYQTEEERKKSLLIKFSDKIREQIFKMEDLDFFRGRIEFSLNCLDYNGNPNDFNSELFDKVYNVIIEHFNDASSDKISNNIRRALLSISDNDGKYEFYGYWWSYWYVGDANKRCLIDNFRELEYYMYYTEYDIYLKKLILELTQKDISNIINDFCPPTDMPNWKVRLIKEADLLDKESKSNYIAISIDNRHCYLLKSKRPRDIDGCYIVK